MKPEHLLGDFGGLSKAIVERLSQHKLAERTGRDRACVARWLAGRFPKETADVAVIIQTALAEGLDLARFQTFAPIYDLSEFTRYEQAVQQGPPDLSWLTNARVPPPTKRTICGISVSSPIGIASSPLMADDSWAGLMLDLGFGLSTFKTRRPEECQSWVAPQIAYVVDLPDLSRYDPAAPPRTVVTFSRPKSGTVPEIVNSLGVPSEKPGGWKPILDRILRHERGRTVGASVMGAGKTDSELVNSFERAISEAAEVTPAFIELNVSCPNLEKGGQLFGDLQVIERICRQARRKLSGAGRPLFVKSPYLRAQDMDVFVKAIAKSVDAIVLRNAIRVRPVTRNRDGLDVPAFPGRDFGGLTGPSTYDLTRSAVRSLVQVRTRMKADFAVIAVGGVSSSSDVVELLNEGALAVQACTAPMFDPLLAWKARYHVNRADTLVVERSGPSPNVEILLFPIHESEFESYRNAEEAIRVVRKRSPGVDLSHERFTRVWNDWMKESPTVPSGTSQRIRAARGVPDWVRVFTR